MPFPDGLTLKKGGKMPTSSKNYCSKNYVMLATIVYHKNIDEFKLKDHFVLNRIQAYVCASEKFKEIIWASPSGMYCTQYCTVHDIQYHVTNAVSLGCQLRLDKSVK